MDNFTLLKRGTVLKYVENNNYLLGDRVSILIINVLCVHCNPTQDLNWSFPCRKQAILALQALPHYVTRPFLEFIIDELY